MTIRLTSFCLALALTLPATAEIYRWRDEQGKLHFSDTAPSQRLPAEKIELQRLNTADPVPVPIYTSARPASAPEAQTNTGQTHDALQAFCVEGEKRYDDLTRVYRNAKSGKENRKRLVLIDENGPITRRAQNAHAETLREHYNAQGCKILPKPNLKL